MEERRLFRTEAKRIELSGSYVKNKVNALIYLSNDSYNRELGWWAGPRPEIVEMRVKENSSEYYVAEGDLNLGLLELAKAASITRTGTGAVLEIFEGDRWVLDISGLENFLAKEED